MTVPQVEQVVLPDGGVVARCRHGDPTGRAALVIPGLSDGLAPLGAVSATVASPPPGAPFDRLDIHQLSHRRDLLDGVTTRDLARDAAAYLDTVMAGPAIVSGSSLGAMVALHVAAARPDLVAALILAAPTAAADDRLRERLTAWWGRLQAGDWHGYASTSIDDAYTDAFAAERRADLATWGFDAPEPALVERHRRLSGAASTHDAVDTIGLVAAPTLLVAGERDPLVDVEAVHALAARLPSARLHVFPGLKHGFAEQAPDAHAAVVAGFLQDLDLL